MIGRTLRLLEARGIDIPDSARKHMHACTDLDVLDRWFDRAVTADDIDEVLAE